MKVSLLITMHNEISEGNFASLQLDNALEMNCFDDIFVLDDGSTDGTWDVIEPYSKKYNNIYLFRNKENSILSNGENRWVTIMREVEKVEPDWVHIRAADVIHSHKSGELMKEQVGILSDKGCNVIKIPLVNLWRSKYRYRIDGKFGFVAETHAARIMWKFDKNYKFSDDQLKAGYHQGAYIPRDLGYDAKLGIINTGFIKPFPIVLLHLAFLNQDTIIKKFRASMRYSEAANKISKSFSSPGPKDMPPVREWYNFAKYNTYFAYYEFNLVVGLTPQIWHKETMPPGTDKFYPPIESLYEVIKEFNLERAEEYKVLYDIYYGANG